MASWVFYVDALFGISHPSAMANWGIALTGLWIPAAVNLAGVRQMAWFQNLTVVLKFLPLLFVAVAGWFFVSKANFGAFNASGGSLYTAIGIAAGVALFSFIGVEVAAALPSLLMLWRYTTASGLTVFTELVDLTVVTVAIPYLMSACAQLSYLVSGRRPVHRSQLARDLSIAAAGALFSMWVTFAAGYSAVYQALVIVMIGIILYAFRNAGRSQPEAAAAVIPAGTTGPEA